MVDNLLKPYSQLQGYKTKVQFVICQFVPSDYSVENSATFNS